MKYRNVVCALDGSEADERIVEALKELQADAENVTLITAIQPPANVYGGMELMALGLADFEVRAQSQAKERLDALASELGIQAETVSALGSPAYEIKRYAKNAEADLILMGSHCRKGLGLLLGSTANGVLHGAPCDVLIVRIEDE